MPKRARVPVFEELPVGMAVSQQQVAERSIRPHRCSGHALILPVRRTHVLPKCAIARAPTRTPPADERGGQAPPALGSRSASTRRRNGHVDRWRGLDCHTLRRRRRGTLASQGSPGAVQLLLQSWAPVSTSSFSTSCWWMSGRRSARPSDRPWPARSRCGRCSDRASGRGSRPAIRPPGWSARSAPSRWHAGPGLQSPRLGLLPPRSEEPLLHGGSGPRTGCRASGQPRRRASRAPHPDRRRPTRRAAGPRLRPALG